MIRAALLLAAALAADGAAAETCMMPLEGGAPVNEVEARQPQRIIDWSGVIEGFSFVLALPRSREAPGNLLHTVRGMRYEPLGAEFPRAAPISVRRTPPRPDGSVYAWEGRLPVLYRLSAGAESFAPVPESTGASRFGYDPAEDRLMMQRDGVLFDVGDDGFTPSPVGGLAREGAPKEAGSYPDRFTLPRLVPPLGIHLASDEVDGAIWARGAQGGWKRLGLTGPFRENWQAVDGDWFDDREAGIVTVLAGRTALVFDARAPGEVRPLYQFSTFARAAVSGAPALFWEDTQTGAEPRLVQARREGPAAPPGEPVRGAFLESRITGALRLPDIDLLALPEFGAALVRHAGGVAVYAGGRVRAAPDYDVTGLGRTAYLVRFGGRVFLKSEKGLFEIGADLVPVARPLPFQPRGLWEVRSSAAFGGAIVRDDAGARAWITPDGQSFKPIGNLTGKRLRALGSDIPGRRAMLAATEGGAALIGDCP